MFDQKDCHIKMITHKADRFHQFFCLVRIHAGCRLIQKQKLRISCKCSVDLQFSLLSIWQVRSQILGILLKVEHFQKLHRTFIHLFFHLTVMRQTQNPFERIVVMMIVQSYFYIVQYGHL